MATFLLAAAAAVTGGVGLAQAQFAKPLLVADATKVGHIDFYLAGELGATMTVREQAGGGTRRLGAIVLDERGHGVIKDAARWRCDRLSRRFLVSGLIAGRPMTGSYGVRTPSCRERLDMALPRQVPRGAKVLLRIRDRWRIGDLRLRLCVTEPGGRRRCRNLRMARNNARITKQLRAGVEGRSRVELTAPGLRVSETFSVGEPPGREGREGRKPTILAAGDSLMQGVDASLADRFASRARVSRDVIPNSGISKPGFDWLRHSRERTRRVRPEVSVIFLGANEGFGMRIPGRGLVECCNPVWIAEFTSRVRRMMVTYGRGGRADVFWLSVPAPRDRERQLLQGAVNASVLRAAKGLRRVRIVRLDRVFTPGGRYRDVMTYRGRRLRVREGDGIHFSPAGAEIVADKVAAALRSARVVR